MAINFYVLTVTLICGVQFVSMCLQHRRITMLSRRVELARQSEREMREQLIKARGEVHSYRRAAMERELG